MQAFPKRSSLPVIFALCFIAAVIISTPLFANPPVHWAGSLRQMMHGGDISEHARLANIKSDSTLFALGAVTGLKGEITIVGGKAYVASVSDTKVTIDSTYTAGANLLIWTNVERWREIVIPEGLTDSTLETYIAMQAEAGGLDTSGVIPFRLVGESASLSCHVVNWLEGDTIHTHEKHLNSGIRRDLAKQPVTVLGFYSRHHAGVFNHHDSFMHMHVLSQDHSLSAHVDAFVTGKGMTLYIPE